MKIKRDEYLKELIDAQWDGQINVITGLRRSGKSYLLKTLFRDYLRRERGVDGDRIFVLELDLAKFAAYRNPIRLAERVEEWAKGGAVDPADFTVGYAASEDEAVAKVAIVSPDESIVTSGDYAGCFTKTAAPAAGESGRWGVSAELNEEVVSPEPVAVELAGRFGEIEEGVVMIMGAKPGFWYSVKEGDELGEELVEGPRVQAAADGSVALKVTKFPTSGFYRVVVGATGNAE